MNSKSLAFLLMLAAGIPHISESAPQSSQSAQPKGDTATTGPVRPGYAGDAACVACHRDQSFAYAHTSHHLTSQFANRQTVLGPFRPPANVLTISDPGNASLPALFFRMEAKEDSLCQTALTGWGDQLLTRSERIDVVTGSGVRGQTYLYWRGDRLFELPISYWADGHRWVNSPGFIDGTADFSRPINPGCLECHATYIRPLSSDALTNSYEKQSLVMGISCETCHGPAAEHVARYSAGPPREVPGADTAILNPARFSRDRQVDACAVCHSGIQREALAPPFSFVPGRPLGDYFRQLPTEAAAHPDVHGNQVGLLERSRCYQASPQMSCSTCHDTHSPEKAAASYSSRCLICHQWTNCGASKRLGHKIVDNCIDCHMPVEQTNLIISATAGEVVRARLRNHWIRVYPGSQTP